MSKRSHSVFSIMLVAVVFAVFTGSCSKSKKGDGGDPGPPATPWVDDIRSRISENIDDPKKSSEMFALVDSLEQMLEEFDVDVQNYYRQILEVNADYNATREDFERVRSRFETRRKAARREAMALRFQLKNLATKEEWKRLSDKKESIIEVWQRTPASGKSEE